MTELKQIAEQQIAEGQFDGTLDFKERPAVQSSFKAQVNIETREMQIKHDPEFEKKHPGKSEIVIRDITRHEINHIRYRNFHGCPRTIDLHAKKIFEPINTVLKPKGYSCRDTGYLANALEDCVLHSDLSSKFTLEGITEFFNDIGEHNPYTDFYEAHVRLNLYLFGSKKQKQSLEKHLKYKQEVNEVIQNFLKRTGIADLKTEIIVNGKNIKVKDRNKIRDFLNDENNWAEIAKIYAEEFSKLMKPGYAMPNFDNSGKGTKGNELEEGEGKIEPEEIDIPSESPFDREMFSKKYIERRVQEAHAEGKPVPSWIGRFQALDLLYQSLAKRLEIKVESFTETQRFPIYSYGSRPFNPEKDNLKKVRFGFDDKGKIELKKRRYVITQPLEYKVNPKGFPEVRFCLIDTSGSMLSDPNNGGNIGNQSIIPWGNNSKYHYALLAWYGLLEYLKQNNLLKQTGISLGNFSNETIVGLDLAEAKKNAFNPQFGMTQLDFEKIKKMFSGRDMLMFTISDGDIQNWEDIKDNFLKYAGRHHYFHLQIGAENSMSLDLENAGFLVRYVRGNGDLANIVINLTDKLYRGQ